MIRRVIHTVTVQPGGRIEVISPDLPEGAQAEVTVRLSNESPATTRCMGLFADEVELLDQIAEDALTQRSRPLRIGHG